LPRDGAGVVVRRAGERGGAVDVGERGGEVRELDGLLDHRADVGRRVLLRAVHHRRAAGDRALGVEVPVRGPLVVDVVLDVARVDAGVDLPVGRRGRAVGDVRVREHLEVGHGRRADLLLEDPGLGRRAGLAAGGDDVDDVRARAGSAHLQVVLVAVPERAPLVLAVPVRPGGGRRGAAAGARDDRVRSGLARGLAGRDVVEVELVVVDELRDVVVDAGL